MQQNRYGVFRRAGFCLQEKPCQSDAFSGFYFIFFELRKKVVIFYCKFR